MPMRVLILGGTTEASAIARGLAGDTRFEVVLSFAGRTIAPVPPPVPYRVGGFGGATGLTAYIAAHGVDVLVDATHPFAAQMRAHAATVAIPRIAVLRPAWLREPGDDWRDVASMAAAAAALGTQPRRVFLTVGQQELAPFGPPHRYLIRSVDPLLAVPPGAVAFTARGPFDVAGERALLADHDIQILVTKNSGGSATAAKLVAARALGVAVVMVARPPLPAGDIVPDAAGALAWLHQIRLRGV